MQGHCFLCKENCFNLLDWHCNQCSTSTHYACHHSTNKQGQYECPNCKLPYNNLLVGHWALDTFNSFKVRKEGDVFDVNYVLDGFVVAVQPFAFRPAVGGAKSERRFVPMHLFIAANCPRQMDARVREHWKEIESKLTSSVDLI